MRNLDRIETFLGEIGKLWREKFPDWRFGQLMYNFFCELGDPFYYEEDEFLEAFKAYCNRENPKEAVKKYREQKSGGKMSQEEMLAKYAESIRKYLRDFDAFEVEWEKELEKENRNVQDDIK